jgi:hypothetical protein
MAESTRKIAVAEFITLDGAVQAPGEGDEYMLHVYSLGSGKRLFPEGKRINLKLIESQALPTGVVFQHYEHDKQAS